MSTTKLTGRENLTNNAFWLSPCEFTDNEIQVKMFKSTVLVTFSLRNGKYPNPYQIEKQDSDPDPHRSEKQDPDPDQKVVDPQYCWWLIILLLSGRSFS